MKKFDEYLGGEIDRFRVKGFLGVGSSSSHEIGELAYSVSGSTYQVGYSTGTSPIIIQNRLETVEEAEEILHKKIKADLHFKIEGLQHLIKEAEGELAQLDKHGLDVFRSNLNGGMINPHLKETT